MGVAGHSLFPPVISDEHSEVPDTEEDDGAVEGDRLVFLAAFRLAGMLRLGDNGVRFIVFRMCFFGPWYRGAAVIFL